MDWPQFELEYLSGTTVVPPKEAPGIFVFDTKSSAEKYAQKFHKMHPMVLRVIPIGKAIKLKQYRPAACGAMIAKRFWEAITKTIKASSDRGILGMYLQIGQNNIADVDGTLIYPAVRVME